MKTETKEFQVATNTKVICAKYEAADPGDKYQFILDISTQVDCKRPEDDIQYKEVTSYTTRGSRDVSFIEFSHMEAYNFYDKAIERVYA